MLSEPLVNRLQSRYEIFMVTPDKDYGQLVDGNIKTGYQKGGDAEILGATKRCYCQMEY